MSLSEFKKASFASRLMTLFALTLLFVFTALVLLENRELEKVFPHSLTRSLAILSGYCVAILSTNYFMALRGRNFIEWKLELLIAFNFIGSIRISQRNSGAKPADLRGHGASCKVLFSRTNSTGRSPHDRLQAYRKATQVQGFPVQWTGFSPWQPARCAGQAAQERLSLSALWPAGDHYSATV